MGCRTRGSPVTAALTSRIDLPRFNPLDPALLGDPYPTYARYREADPIHWGWASMSDLPGSWYLFRHQDNADILADADLYASDPATVGLSHAVPEAFRPVAHVFQRWLGGMDPPDHRRLRAIMAKAFTPRRVAALQPRIADITSQLIAQAMAKSSEGIDLIADVAFPLPMAVVGDALGVAPQDWALFQQWSADLSHAVDRAGDPEAAKLGGAAVRNMVDYFAEAVGRRRSSPGDDLLDAMVAAADDDGQPMREFDAIAIATELGVAGHETSTNAIAKSVLGLMDQRDRWEELKALSDKAFDEALDELLRWATPVQRQRWRWVTESHVRDGRVFEKGHSVVAILGAANRDPAVFPQPDRIDFGRAPAARHLTFGFGVHFCLGAALARLEFKTALQALMAAMPDMQLVATADEIQWRNNFILPGPLSVRVH
jgi:cytochrome P450